MSTWAPGDGAPDLLSSGPEGPPWWDRFRTAAVAVVCLAAGAALGTSWDGAVLPVNGQAAGPPAALTAGSVSALDDPGDPRAHGFEVNVFNAGEQELRVFVVRLIGSSTTVTTGGAETVPPKSWARVPFWLPEMCTVPTPPYVTALRVRVLQPGSAEEPVLNLAEPADAVVEHHERECRPTTALSRGRLTGLWYVEEWRGRWEELAGRSLMRFTSDGRFAFDPEGWMFVEGRQGFFGTYRLQDDQLRLRAEGGYACEVGFREVWRTTLLEEDRLQLDIVRSDGGYCHTPPGDQQVLRRLVPERRLPPISTSQEPSG